MPKNCSFTEQNERVDFYDFNHKVLTKNAIFNLTRFTQTTSKRVTTYFILNENLITYLLH